MTSAEASLIRLSPSRMLIDATGDAEPAGDRGGGDGSVGATIAPSAKHAAHGSPFTRVWATTATAPAVATTRPVESSVMLRASARRSRRLAKNAPEYSSGGRKTTSTSSGASSMSGIPGTKPSTSPPSTSRIGYGTPIRLASALSTTTATSRLMMTVSMCFTRRAP